MKAMEAMLVIEWLTKYFADLMSLILIDNIKEPQEKSYISFEDLKKLRLEASNDKYPSCKRLNTVDIFSV